LGYLGMNYIELDLFRELINKYNKPNNEKVVFRGLC
jgi:hypothetical protein